jgi:hypothetical protein
MKPLLEFQGRAIQPLFCEPGNWPATWWRYGERPWSAILAARASSAEPIGVHCFTDDARFESLWTTERARLLLAEHADVCCAPDFSFSPDANFAPALFQLWRSNILAGELQRLGLRVVPVLAWGPRFQSLYEYAAEGIAPGSAVALRMAGTIAERARDYLFWEPLSWFIDRVKPSEILWCGAFEGPHCREVLRRVGSVTPVTNRLVYAPLD